MVKYARTRSLKPETGRSVSHFFPLERKTLYEKALPNSSKLTSLYNSPSIWDNERIIFMIEELAQLGDEESILILNKYIDSKIFGKAAVKAVRTIRERLMYGAGS
jgi:hypothetical protein